VIVLPVSEAPQTKSDVVHPCSQQKVVILKELKDLEVRFFGFASECHSRNRSA
jgi:hypothetical protein